MKFSLALLLILSLAACIGTIAIHRNTNIEKDKVIITETTLYGDPTHAEGITADSFIECAHHLFWNSRISLGQNPTAQTDFTFRSLSPSFGENDPYRISLYTTGYHFGSSTSSGFDFDDEYFYGLSAMIKDVASRANTDEYSETVNLRDYYEFYPVNISLDFDRFHYDTGAPTNRYQKFALDEAFKNFFKIPIPDEFYLNVEIGKKDRGMITTVNVSPAKVEEDYFMNLNAVRDSSRIFITLNPFTEAGKRIDTSHIPGGYGIYVLPYTDIPTEEITIQSDQLKVCYPLEENVRVLELAFSADRSQLLLTTREGNSFFLTVIDPSTMTPLQKLEFASSNNPDVFYTNHHYYDDFILLHSGYAEQPAKLIVLTQEENGLYRVALQTQREPSGEFEDPYFAFYCVNADWDGQRLILANYDLTNNTGSLCRFYVRVYDKTGIQYIGQYDNSLDPAVLSPSNRRCEPVNREALKVNIVG